MSEPTVAPTLLQVTGILERLREQMPELAERYHVSYLGVFGSYVRGEQHADSDLDVLVEFHKAPSLFTYVGLEQELSDLLGIQVDLVRRSGLKPRIGKRILAEVIRL
jgi:uncharacterized protein